MGPQTFPNQTGRFGLWLGRQSGLGSFEPRETKSQGEGWGRGGGGNTLSPEVAVETSEGCSWGPGFGSEESLP